MTSRPKNTMEEMLQAFGKRVRDRKAEQEQIITCSRNKRSATERLCNLVSEEICRATDGNLTAIEYVQRQMARQQLHLFTGTHWTPLPMQQYYDFVKSSAYRTGLSAALVENPRFMGLLFEQVAFRVAQFRQFLVPPGEVWVNLRNVTLEVDAEGRYTPREHRREDFFTYVLPYDYNPSAECPLWHQFLDQVLPEPEAQLLLGEHIGYCFTRRLKLERMAVLKGGGANGKSVTTDVITELLGHENVSHVDLEQLTCNENQRAQAVGKLANISQENGPGIQYSVLKNMISGEPVMVKNLYKDPYPTTNYGKIFASYNTLPKPEQTHGNYRRWDILDYRVTITEEERDVNLKQKLCAELPGILNWVLGCLQGLVARQAFTQSESCKESIRAYMRDSNSALRFFEENCVVNENGRVTAAELFAAYLRFCSEEGVTNRYGKINLLRQLEQLGVHQNRIGGIRWLNVMFKGN